MIKPRIQEAINRQINAEFYSNYLYLSMSAWMESKGLSGMARWLLAHYEEEAGHAIRFVNYLNERGGRVLLDTIDAPPTDWDSPINVFKDALEHEYKVTSMINDLVDIALEERDHAASTFLQWFINEQVEEESTFKEIVDKFELGQEHPGFLYMLDKELGERQTVSIANIADNQ
ncbi:MAG: ferritin [bacterium]|nr:ferritin [bacterium]